MATLRTLPLSLLLLSLSSYSLSTPLPPSNPSSSFKVALIHRDSPYSPMHDSSVSSSDIFGLSVDRSVFRIRYIRSVLAGKSSPLKIESPVKVAPFEYLMRVGIGTPAKPYWLIADTGSDLTWTQCRPCDICFKQKAPIFDPSSSSTYHPLKCSTPLCRALEGDRICDGSSCQYQYAYGDGSATLGNLSTETFTFESPKSTVASLNPSILAKSSSGATGINPTKTSTSTSLSTNHVIGAKIKGIGFGCSFSNTGNMGGDGEAGLVGLGGGPLSLVSQIGSSISNKFSYCLASRHENNTMSVLNFGKNADISGPNVSSTPIVQMKAIPTFYFLNLSDISIGSKRLHIPQGTFDPSPSGDSGLIIDSGTTMTVLSSMAFSSVLKGLNKTAEFPPLDNPPEPFEACYKVPDPHRITGLPDITFHFSGNADWKWEPRNSFYIMPKNVVCLLMGRSSDISILGNMQQQNMVVEYDLKEKKLSFAPARCSQF
ncbi:hypothetical protein AMTRI_Chr01g128200 [Amborella trichopoda]